MFFQGPILIYWRFMGQLLIPIFLKILNLVFCFIINNIMYSMLYLFNNFKNQDL